MIKRRPVVVISPKETHNRKLCTVIPLSTTPPIPEQPWHYCLKQNYTPHPANGDTWAKCDMIYTVSFSRLDKMHKKTRSGREYYLPKIDDAELEAMMNCVRAYLKRL